MKVYIVGSLRNPRVPEVAAALRDASFEVFDDWYSGGPEADDCWQKHQKSKGLTYKQALAGPAAQNIFAFDLKHIDEADAVVMVAPAGKSGHLELGYAIGSGKVGLVLMEQEPERYDVMLNFADQVCESIEEVIDTLDYYDTFK